MRPKNMRDIPTIQGLVHRSQPKTREQAVNELARLEHEKARLQRELDIWLANRKQTEQRLQRVEERLALLQRILTDSSDETNSSPASRSRRKSGSQAAGAGKSEGKVWKEISLEY
jgi:ferric-dicitrate binding protein FerR (iron transport regulator)